MFTPATPRKVMRREQAAPGRTRIFIGDVCVGFIQHYPTLVLTELNYELASDGPKRVIYGTGDIEFITSEFKRRFPKGLPALLVSWDGPDSVREYSDDIDQQQRGTDIYVPRGVPPVQSTGGEAETPPGAGPSDPPSASTDTPQGP